MSTNFYFVFGFPKIGKSKIVEDIISAKKGKALYIGTLWYNSKTIPVIKLHKARREEGAWLDLEIYGDFEYDSSSLARKLEVNSDIKYILIDGIFNSFVFYLKRNNCLPMNVINWILDLVTIIVEKKPDSIYFVDNFCEIYPDEFSRKWSSVLHEKLLEHIKK